MEYELSANRIDLGTYKGETPAEAVSYRKVYVADIAVGRRSIRATENDHCHTGHIVDVAFD